MSMKIISDSACDLPQELIEVYDISVLPFLVYIDGKEYKDGINITTQEVYAAIRAGKQPTTAQVSIDDIVNLFKECAEQKKHCLYLSFSSKLSGTCNSVRLIAREMKEHYRDFQITIVDTLSGSLGQGLIVLEAAQMAKAGKDPKDIIKRVRKRSINNVEHIFSVDDLNYLYRGGRVNYASAFLGGLLHVKPILHVQNGLMIPLQKVRGKQMAIKRIVELLKERSLGNLNQTIGITHADDPLIAKQLQTLLQDSLGYKDFVVNLIGSVLACHIGIGGIAAFFVNDRISEGNLNPL